jgi:hypothetical protein
MSLNATLLAEADGFFTVLPASLTTTEARAVLAAGTLGVVRADDGTVTATVLQADLDSLDTDDLDGAGPRLPPAIVADAEVTFAEFGASPAVTLLDVGARAVVLVEAGQVVGVLPIPMVGAYLASRSYAPPSSVMAGSGTSDASLPGEPRTGLANVICAELDCGHLNTLASFNRRRPPHCTNPGRPRHVLRIGGTQPCSAQ